MAGSNALEQLKAAGLDAEQLPEAQRQVLADLSQEEVETMISIREKLTGAADDVSGYLKKNDDTGIFYY
jgi:hypothetical protein